MKSTLMRRLSILLVLALVLAMLPVAAMAADSTTLYLSPNANWKKDGARFAAYFFQTGKTETWVDMTDADADGVYEVVVPEGYTNVIFCRMNPGIASNSWKTRWNQTSNLKVPTDGTSLYTVAEGAWDKGAGAWSVYTPGDEVTEVTTAPLAYDYYVAGDFTGWSECNDDYGMTAGTDGLYSVTFAITAGKHKMKITNGTWTDAVGGTGDNADTDGNYVFSCATDGDLTVTFNATDKTFELSGDCLGDTPVDPVEDTWHVKGNVAGLDWDLTTGTGAMTKNDDGSYSLTIADVAAAGKYSVKAVKNSAWEGAAGGMGAGGNYEFSVSAECDVTFTVADGVLTVTGANVGEPVASEIVVESVVVAGNGDGSMSGSGWLNGVSWDPASSVNQMYLEEGSTTVYSITYYNIPAGTYEFKFAVNGSWDICYASGVEIVSGEAATAWFDAQGDSSVVVAEDGSTITLVLDMTNVAIEGDNASMTVTVEAPNKIETSAPETLVVGENDFVIGTGDMNNVVGTFTATADGILNIFPTAMSIDTWGEGVLEAVPAEYISMQFGRQYGIVVNGELMYLPIAIEVTAGQSYEIGVVSPSGKAAEVTLTLCDNHNIGYSFSNGVHTVGCTSCGQVTTIEDSTEFKIKSAFLTLSSDVSVIFRASIPTNFNNAYMVFTVNGNEYCAYSYGVDENGFQLFSYPGINPQMMGDNIHAVLYASVNGMEVTPVKSVDYSVLTYCNKQLPTAGKNFKTLISDLLVYGAASQIKLGYKTDALVTDLATTTLTPSTFPGVDAITNQQNAIGDKNPIADVTGVGLNLSNQVVCKFGFTITDEDPYKYTIKIKIGSKESEYTMYDCYEDGGKYWINYCDYSASQFDDTITVTLWDGETQVGRTFTYSVNSYFFKNANSADAGLAQLVQAVYNYGVSAKNYVANPNG